MLRFVVVVVVVAACGGESAALDAMDAKPDAGVDATADANTDPSICHPIDAGAALGAGCDPLTQCARAAQSDACGSPDQTLPVNGCFGPESFVCQPTAPGTSITSAMMLTDRVPAAGNDRNYCAPGFVGLLIQGDGMVTLICSGWCAALETDSTPAHAGNAKGDPDVYAKLPTESGLKKGNATCDVGKKGSEATSVCRFMWPYALDSQGQLPAEFEPYKDTLGICFGRTHYQYDANDNGMLDVNDPVVPDCATLPPRSQATPGRYDDAADFSCQKISSSSFTGMDLAAIRPDAELLGRIEPVPASRHVFR